MTYPKLFALIATASIATILLLAFFKKSGSQERPPMPFVYTGTPIAVELETEVRPKRIAQQASPAAASSSAPVAVTPAPVALLSDPTPSVAKLTATPPPSGQGVGKVVPPPPEADRIAELFNKGEPKLPFVETIVYKSSAPWQKGRPAWLADYASYYETSRHFIARSLNGNLDYLRQEVTNGDRFNVFRKDKEITFYLLVDINRLKLWFYVIDQGSNERTLLKTYRVGLGRLDSAKASGSLTPLGKYLLGDKVAIYQPKVQGHHKGQRIEMMRVFGSRWIPFEKELEGCSEPAKGFGLHGVPWALGAEGVLKEDQSSLGKYESDGCIRLADADVKELFAIILTKPTTIEIIKDFYTASLPGVEK